MLHLTGCGTGTMQSVCNVAASFCRGHKPVVLCRAALLHVSLRRAARRRSITLGRRDHMERNNWGEAFVRVAFTLVFALPGLYYTVYPPHVQRQALMDSDGDSNRDEAAMRDRHRARAARSTRRRAGGRERSGRQERAGDGAADANQPASPRARRYQRLRADARNEQAHRVPEAAPRPEALANVRRDDDGFAVLARAPDPRPRRGSARAAVEDMRPGELARRSAAGELADAGNGQAFGNDAVFARAARLGVLLLAFAREVVLIAAGVALFWLLLRIWGLVKEAGQHDGTAADGECASGPPPDAAA